MVSPSTAVEERFVISLPEIRCAFTINGQEGDSTGGFIHSAWIDLSTPLRSMRPESAAAPGVLNGDIYKEDVQRTFVFLDPATTF